MNSVLETTLATLTSKVAAGRSVREDVRMDNLLREGEVVAQGDVLFTWAGDYPASLPSDAAPLSTEQRLVPGTDDGGKHFLVAKTPGVYATSTPTDPDTLTGPTIYLAPGATAIVEHRGSGMHGPLTLCGPGTISVTYPKEFNKEEQKARRARD